MANVLPFVARVEVTRTLVDGCSVRATERLTGVTKKTILRFVLELGEGCRRLHDRLVRNVETTDIEADEAWSFVWKKQARCKPTDPEEWGDAYTFVAMARHQKLVISYLTGKRDDEHARQFVHDLKSRLVVAPRVRVQLSTDGFQPYIEPVMKAFGLTIDYGQVVKQYGSQQKDDHRYEPSRVTEFIRKTAILGAPSESRMSTSMIERQNLTMRMHIRRMTRLTNAFSKKLHNLRAAIALHFMWYNFCRVHETIRVTPAMEAGIADHVWGIDELVARALAEPAAVTPPPSPLTPPGGQRPPVQLELFGAELASVFGLDGSGDGQLLNVANDNARTDEAAVSGEPDEEVPPTVRDPMKWVLLEEAPAGVG